MLHQGRVNLLRTVPVPRRGTYLRSFGRASSSWRESDTIIDLFFSPAFILVAATDYSLPGSVSDPAGARPLVIGWSRTTRRALLVCMLDRLSGLCLDVRGRASPLSSRVSVPVGSQQLFGNSVFADVRERGTKQHGPGANRKQYSCYATPHAWPRTGAPNLQS